MKVVGEPIRRVGWDCLRD